MILMLKKNENVDISQKYTVFLQ